MTLLQDVLDHARRLPGVREDFPFDFETLTLKVAGKIFLLTSLRADPVRLNLKCDPERALELRARYPEHVLPGYHMNKRHWNTLVLDGTLPRPLVEELIDHSYARVLAGLPRRIRAALARGVEEGEAE
ncbi:MmcQ/YjbR family DNA-binding protein [Oceanithermus desulfurans]|uniref:DNA-binding protein n=2 Tax=Oceanithermus desulfurans TaxID=227924 RepID=A0A511RI24_9DEIN|nr:MmcQ/YjbR family DNA-binding protein [Oceanithermus desulfurans]MBB6030395.1 putative DNA-binding protein (MmcQ/YjbR family) [Oceanithermus desulfurans]GEM89304.1 DNA-binding protein [Oceanithermus desulfurans NBRC 100063]